MPRFTVALVALMLAAAPAAAQQVPFALEAISDSFDSPLFVTSPPADPRLFVVEQGGRIRIVADGEVQVAPFLDVSGQVSSGGEQGLLGLAFHPDYATNGRFFINYTDRSGDTQIVAYTVSSDADVADADSAATLLSIDQPRANHNGGWLGFGPDGFLYIGVGDGGGAGDPQRNGQDIASLLGKILRIDVDAGTPYAIPAGNPYADGGGAPEAFISGLRNPWRPSFDGRNLYIADVGQNAWEEIHVVTIDDGGANLGWNIMEGRECFRASSCDEGGLVLPVHVYSHQETGGCSITGGYVYRGKAIPEIEGLYFFADYCGGVLQSLRYAGGEAREVTDYRDALGVIGPITSFGTDSVGEMYLVTQDGKLMKFVKQ